MQAMELTLRSAVRLVATPTPMREMATRASTKVKAAIGRLWRARIIIVIIRAIVIPPLLATETVVAYVTYLLPEAYSYPGSYNQADGDSTVCRPLILISANPRFFIS